jgi:16S rRNA (guanine527-N7)-methyltransferase
VSEALAREIYPEAFAGLDRFASLLATEGLTRGLLGPNELGRLWDRHILNCAQVEEVIPQGATVVDIGSGAGLPGLVLTLVRPDLDVTLVDTQARRVKFLAEAIDQLGLGSRCRADQGRVPEFWNSSGQEVPTTVVARALAPLGDLMTWVWPVIEKGAVLLAIKGQGAQLEVDEFLASGSALVSKCHVELLGCGSGQKGPSTTVIRAARG